MEDLKALIWDDSTPRFYNVRASTRFNDKLNRQGQFDTCSDTWTLAGSCTRRIAMSHQINTTTII